MLYQKHIFVCTNQRKEGAKKSCGEAHGLALIEAFRKKIKALNLNVNIRTQKAGCLDVCEHGPAVAVYPEGVFYGNVQLSDVDDIVTQHIRDHKPVERLIIRFEKKESV
jgi:(2Fe-2S) ferredoxin